MGFTGAWMISGHEDGVIAELAPRFLPAIEAERSEPYAREHWEEWLRTPFPDRGTRRAGHANGDYRDPESGALRSFEQLTGGGRHIDNACYGDLDDSFYVADDVWARQPDPHAMFCSVHVKKYPLAHLFHAIGPERAARLPGWCGNFLLTSAEVRQSLPQVERALSFTPEARAAADDRLEWLECRPDEESLIDGPLRIWRHASAAGLGLIGLNLHIN